MRGLNGAVERLTSVARALPMRARALLARARARPRATALVAAGLVVVLAGGAAAALARDGGSPEGEASTSASTESSASPSTDGPSSTPSTSPSTSSSPTTAPTPTEEPGVAPASSTTFYVDPETQAMVLASSANPEEVALLGAIANTPQARWIGDWFAAGAAQASAQQYAAGAVAAGKTPFLVLYAIPGRDCGQHSAGGLTADEYPAWVSAVAAGLQGTGAWVVLEPDSLAQLGDCDGQGDRVGLLKQAAATLDAAGVRVYLDGGHSGWRSASDMAERLDKVGFEHAAGFALNVSNYTSTDAERAYGDKVSRAAGGSPHFVIDTSRNGNGGAKGQWCNVRGQALGTPTRLATEDPLLDAYLWIKHPGQSDGTCGGGPGAGQWWHEIALELARGAGL